MSLLQTPLKWDFRERGEGAISYGERAYQLLLQNRIRAERHGYWISFYIGTPTIPAIDSYNMAVHQWKVMVNPKREFFLGVLDRIVKALARAGIHCTGKLPYENCQRHSRLNILDDPCEPKIILYFFENEQSDADNLLVRATAAFEGEFSEEERSTFACPSGHRYREDLCILVPQHGPSFTKMRSPLMFYQQGGYIESERKLIVQTELERRSEGLQTSSQTADRIDTLLRRFFKGENFYLHRANQDPLVCTTATTTTATTTTTTTTSLPVATMCSERVPIFPSCVVPTPRISWVTGSSSSSLVPIFRFHVGEGPGLIPTGILLRHNIAPLCGELSVGIDCNGVNQQSLSGFSIDYCKDIFRYAAGASPDLDSERRQIFALHESTTDFLLLQRAKIAALRIAALDRRGRNTILKHLKDIIETIPPLCGIEGGWQDYLSLLGKKVPQTAVPEKFVPSFGNIVVAPHTKDNCIGVLIGRDPFSGEIQVLFGQCKTCEVSPDQVVPVGEQVLDKYLSQYPSDSQGFGEYFREYLQQGIGALRYQEACEHGAHAMNWEKYASLVGLPIDVEALVPRAGQLVGISSGPEDYRYALVARVDPSSITVVGDPFGSTVQIGRPFNDSVIAISRQLIDRDRASYPLMFDPECLIKKIHFFMMGPRERFEEMYFLLQKRRWKLTSLEKKFIYNPFPIVWGSFTKGPTPFSTGTVHEQTLFGTQRLGVDIQVVFTENARVHEVEDYFKEQMPKTLTVQVAALSVFKAFVA